MKCVKQKDNSMCNKVTTSYVLIYSINVHTFPGLMGSSQNSNYPQYLMFSFND